MGLVFMLSVLGASELKVRIIVDDSSIKATPEITGKTMAKVALNTVLSAEEKADGWYKVTLEREGVKISGYIHEMLVEEFEEGEIKQEERVPEARPQTLAPVLGTSGEVVREIEIKIESSKSLIRQNKDLEAAVETLRPLIARAFRIADGEQQRKLAAEIFLWKGLAHVGQGDNRRAMQELRNMFEVDHGYALEITRNIMDKKIVALIAQAEKEYLGIIAEYTLEITTTPPEAQVRIDGVDKGLSPGVFTLKTPFVFLEVEKPGYKKVTEELFFNQASLRKDIVLEQLGRDVEVTSIPSGASVFLDEGDTGSLTDCLLKNVPLGPHKVKIAKENHVEWESQVEVEEGSEPFRLDVVLAANNYVSLKFWGGANSRLFKTPLAVAVDSEGSAFIVDDSDAKIRKVNAEGRALSWRPGGRGFPGFKSPENIAIDNQGHIYVSDTRRHAVFKFDSRGMFVQGWGSEGSGERELRSPKGMAFNSQNDVFIVDSGNSRIQRYSDSGVFKQSIGRQGASDGEFVSPVDLATNQADELFVLDRIRVQKFSPEGEFVSAIRLAELGRAGVKIPQTIHIDSMGYIYLADSGNHAVVKISPDGILIAEWGGYGTREGRFNYPIAIALNSAGEVLVVERDNNRVQIFGVPGE